MDQNNWTIFVPIYNLEISDDIGGKLKIENVTFISSTKISNVRKQLGLFEPVSYYKKLYKPDKLFTKAKVYALIKSRRNSKDDLNREFNLIKEAVYILASSQYFSDRKHRIHFGGPEFGSNLIDEYLLFENNNNKSQRNLLRLTPANIYRLDKQWKTHIIQHFFHPLLKIINRKIHVTEKWRTVLRTAAILAGQSHFARNLWESFLYNWIAIEIILTDQGDKMPDSLINRIVALFGWRTNEDTMYWEGIIKELYKVRCKFVHEGNYPKIQMKHIINSDTILLNLLHNLCNLVNKIKSKEEIKDLSDILLARRKLGQKMKERPKGICFFEKIITPKDYEKLESIRHWSW